MGFGCYRLIHGGGGGGGGGGWEGLVMVFGYFG